MYPPARPRPQSDETCSLRQIDLRFAERLQVYSASVDANLFAVEMGAGRGRGGSLGGIELGFSSVGS